MNSFQTASIAAKKALPPTLKTSLWLLKLMLPISLAVRLLQYWGIIDAIAQWFSPLFHFLGLPGRAAIPFFTTALNTTYAGIAVMTSIPLTLREATILSVMMVLCHALPVEKCREQNDRFFFPENVHFTPYYGRYCSFLPESGSSANDGDFQLCTK